MDRLSDWIGGGRRPEGGIPHDHSLVPANRHPPPAIVYRDAAE